MKIAEYNINTDDILVVGDKISDKEKDFLIENLLLAYEIAKKNKLKGGLLTTSSYACGLIDDKNDIYFGINFNNTRSEISSICAERHAILNIYRKKTEEFNQDTKFQYKIKYILMASYRGEDIYWEEKLTPCADCLSWFNSDPHMAEDTKTVILKKKDNKIFLEINPLGKLLPLRNLSFDISENPSQIKRSEPAKQNNISDEVIKNMYFATIKAYKNNSLAKTSGQNIAASVYSGGEIFVGIKVDFTKRWFIEPLKAAFYKAVEKFKGDTKIDAICYVGDEYTKTESKLASKDGLISLQALGRLNTKFSDENTLVITSSKNSIEVRTVGEFMPSVNKFIPNYEIK